MTIPQTFSAPADATFPALNGYAPSFEDSVRYAVWLSLWIDDVNRKTYSYDRADASKGVRIVQTQPDADPETGHVSLPHQVVGVAQRRTSFTYRIGGRGSKDITIGVVHLEAVDTSFVGADLDQLSAAVALMPVTTIEMKFARVLEILARGTIYREDQFDDPSEIRFALIDPYYTPRNVDGTYDQTELVTLTTMPPSFQWGDRQVIPNPRNAPKNEADWWKLDPVKDFAVAYGLFATYQIDITSRMNMRTNSGG